MKRLVVFMFLLCCLGSTALFKFESNPLFNLEGVEKVCFIADAELVEAEGVNCGDLVFNYCSLSTAKKNLSEYEKNSIGVEFYFQSDVNLEKILTILKADIVTKIEYENLTVLSAYTPYYQNCVYVDGKKINLQIAISDTNIIAGFPVLLTGY